MHRSLRPIGLIATTALCLAFQAGLFADPAVAEDEELLYGRPGGYAMVHAMGGVDVDRRRQETDLGGGAGYLLRVGSRESESLAWELAFEHFMQSTDDHAFWYGINSKIYFSPDRFQPYVILGAGGYTRLRPNESRKTDWGFRSGIGLDMYLTKRWALNAEFAYVAGVGDLLRQEYGSFALGALYRF